MTSCLCFCCSYGNGSVFSSLPLPCFAHILAEMANVKTFEFYAANCSKPNGAKKRKKKKHGLWPILFFEKNTGSNLAMLVRAVTQQTHRPQKRNKNTDFDPLFFSTKRVTCALHSTHHLPKASTLTPHISPQQTHLPPTYLKVTSTRPSRGREDSSPRPQSTVAELPSGTKGCKTSICAHLNTT